MQGFLPIPVATLRRWLPSGRWSLAAIAIALLVSTPILALLGHLFTDTRALWQHLAATVLGIYIRNSLGLMVGVGLGTMVLGTGLAWLVTMCQFWGSGWLGWALLLPLAAPAYILAYVYTDFLDFYGPVQSALRGWFGWQSAQDYWFPNLRSLWGAITMLVLVLYPYVYLLARSAFLSQSSCMVEASRSLGCRPWQGFWRVALPLARPAIVAGVSLALMETLNDYATVQFFSVDTFTTGIYRTWFGLGDRPAATQLSILLLAVILALILCEKASRGRIRFHQGSQSRPQVQPYPLTGGRAALAMLSCLVPLGLGFVLPAGLLLQLAIAHRDQTFDQRFWGFASHSLLAASGAALLTLVVAIILAYGLRLQPTPINRVATQIAALGYAIPGSVIAVGILTALGGFDNAIDSWMRATFNVSTGLLLSGTIAALLFAYVVRFLALSLSTVEASLTQIKPSLDDAARSLGQTGISTLVQIHIPLLWKGLLAAMILVFVDVMKELSATLIIRPFNFDTLAVHVYNLAADERLAEASGSALAIVLVGLVPVILLTWQMERKER
jgi:iron(III) transport system permease protein